jgi:hypothetical protein
MICLAGDFLRYNRLAPSTMSTNLIVSDQILLDTQHKAVPSNLPEPIALGLCRVPLTHFAKCPRISDGCGQYAPPRHSAKFDAGPEPIVGTWNRRIQVFNYPSAAIHAYACSDWNLASSAEATYSDFSYLCIRPQQIPQHPAINMLNGINDCFSRLAE